MADIAALMEDFKQQGLEPEVDEGGDIILKHNGMTYALCFGRDDDAFSTLLLPNIFEVSEENEAPILFLLNEINKRFKWIKASTRQNQVCFVIEMWNMDGTRWSQAMERSLKVMQNALDLFADALRHGASEDES
jgi:hypothetical protein